MASFPGAVKTFTARNAADTIQPAHVNDLQDEVNAIEDGYINGTAPLNSSHSTVASLSVVGGSTFAVRPTTPPPAAVLVGLGSGVAVSSGGAELVLNWVGDDALGGINSSLHSTVTNSSRFTPDSTGVWACAAQVQFSPNSSGYRYALIRDSSLGLVGLAELQAISTPGIETALLAQGLKRFDALGGYLKILVGQDEASTLSVVAAGSQCAFWKL